MYHLGLKREFAKLLGRHCGHKAQRQRGSPFKHLTVEMRNAFTPRFCYMLVSFLWCLTRCSLDWNDFELHGAPLLANWRASI